ncbi:hypothetical protein E2C01_069562 [Portunus trituberculatus]|uniref:Uncharacterized protein n=1 Tax=Portunus trituberculatus TaxID=210409 RepID=A0A5B7I2P1_PORTR|nr:hypothetical protein [Portunus trituberculatus]
MICWESQDEGGEKISMQGEGVARREITGRREGGVERGGRDKRAPGRGRWAAYAPTPTARPAATHADPRTNPPTFPASHQPPIPHLSTAAPPYRPLSFLSSYPPPIHSTHATHGPLPLCICPPPLVHLPIRAGVASASPPPTAHRPAPTRLPPSSRPLTRN